ncbi:MAG: hypothetical protein ACP5I1_14845 [Candidatus Hinthialibacter sp.]
MQLQSAYGLLPLHRLGRREVFTYHESAQLRQAACGDRFAPEQAIVFFPESPFVFPGIGTQDQCFIVESDYGSPSIGYYSCHLNAHGFDSNNSITISSGGALYSQGIIPFYPVRYLYQPLQNRFVSISPKDIIYSQLAISSEDEIRNTYNLLPVYSYPFNEDASKFLAGEFEPRNHEEPHGNRMKTAGGFDASTC